MYLVVNFLREFNSYHSATSNNAECRRLDNDEGSMERDSGAWESDVAWRLVPGDSSLPSQRLSPSGGTDPRAPGELCASRTCMSGGTNILLCEQSDGQQAGLMSKDSVSMPPPPNPQLAQRSHDITSTHLACGKGTRPPAIGQTAERSDDGCK